MMYNVKRIITMLMAVLLILVMSVMPVQASQRTAQLSGGIELPDDDWGCPFKDVKESDYFYDPVLWAVEKKITSGTSATTFSPDEICTRAQVVTFLWRAFGSPEPASSTNPFADVKSGTYFYKAVLWAVEKGITAGTSKTQFSPDASCTRAQVVTFLWRAMGEPKVSGNQNPFSDVGRSDYFYNAVRWAVKNEITAGTGAGKFSPDTFCTRGQVVTFLYRAMYKE